MLRALNCRNIVVSGFSAMRTESFGYPWTYSASGSCGGSTSAVLGTQVMVEGAVDSLENDARRRGHKL